MIAIKQNPIKNFTFSALTLFIGLMFGPILPIANAENKKQVKESTPSFNSFTARTINPYAEPSSVNPLIQKATINKKLNRSKNGTIKASDAITPLLSQAPSKSDKNLFETAIESSYRGNILKARSAISSISHPLIKKIATWYFLRSEKTRSAPEDILGFLQANPDWPNQKRMKERIEARYLFDDRPANKALAYFRQHKPVSVAGQLALIEAQGRKGLKIDPSVIRKLWQNPSLPGDIEKRIIAHHKRHLRPIDHHIRIDRLLYKDRRSKIASALRAAKLHSPLAVKKAQFRAGVIRRRYKAARNLLTKLPASAKNDPGVYLARIQLARRSKKHGLAHKLLKAAKYKSHQIHDADEWWVERRINSRQAVNDRHYQTAYAIASGHENPTVNHFNDAEFLSGWIALRFLKKPKLAEKHFLKLESAADGPRSKSRAAYWLGRSYLALGRKQKALDHFENGANYFNTYYGQLSRQALHKGALPISIKQPLLITKKKAQEFQNRDTIKAIVLCNKAGMHSLANRFLTHYRFAYDDPGELTLLAELAAQLGYNQTSVRIGKTGMVKGYPLTHYAYPTRFLPNFKPIRPIPEKSVIYSIARQESEFNETIISPAGARGLLQVMPGTLRAIARRYKFKARVKSLTSDPVYNAKVGSAYIGHWAEQYNGSYIMTFAGFNAGPGRVRQWVKKFGDPRHSKIDPVDWVERIPFTETRNYVQKVLSNIQVYRARLGLPKRALKILHDLNRGS